MSIDLRTTQILEAAGPIFADKGRKNATIREICAAAEVNLNAVNYYFGDKDNLYRESVRFARESRADRHPFPKLDSVLCPKEKLAGFVETMLKRIVALGDAPWQVRLLMNEVLQPTDVCEDLVEEYFRPVFELLLGIVDELSPRPLDSNQRKKIGFSIIGQCIFYRYSRHVVSLFIEDQDDPDFAVKQLASHISSFCIAAIETGDTQASLKLIRQK